MNNKKYDSSIFIADGAKIVGDVEIGNNSSIWYNAVVRADNHNIIIGKGTNIQDNAVLHVDKDDILKIGSNVTIGHSAIVHGCTIEDNCIIGMGSIIMNGSVIGKNCIIGAGALITERTVIPEGSIVIGSPGRVLRSVTSDEEVKISQSAIHYMELAKMYM
ncbi:MAG: gamma carbonic anhydrase family protein [Lachnospiraceae bacterium]|nr:gamma carbonic anhydrase family protein [Candidatus Colinaster scatohippi]